MRWLYNNNLKDLESVLCENLTPIKIYIIAFRFYVVHWVWHYERLEARRCFLAVEPFNTQNQRPPRLSKTLEVWICILSYDFPSPRVVNNFFFSKISIVRPSATIVMIICEDQHVIGSSRSKLINVFCARIKPRRGFIQIQNTWVHGKHGGNSDAYLPACINNKRVGYLAETPASPVHSWWRWLGSSKCALW